jgi:hypothetical protein
LISFVISEQNFGAFWKNHDAKFFWASSKFLCCPIKVEVSFQVVPKHCGFRVEVRFHGLSFLCGHSEKSQHLEKKNSGCFGNLYSTR